MLSNYPNNVSQHIPPPIISIDPIINSQHYIDPSSDAPPPIHYPISTHLMVTRLKTGHLKPHNILDLSTTLASNHELTSYRATLQQLHWHNVILKE